MITKRKKTIIAMFACMDLLILSGLANALSISGYTAFKDGVRNTLNLRNATIMVCSYATVDGFAVEDFSSIHHLPLSFEYFYIEADLDNGIRYEIDRYGEQYIIKTADNETISVYNGRVSRISYSNSYMNKLNSIFDTQPDLIRVIELLADALSGTSKDYFFTTDENGFKTISAQLKKEQIPEIVGAVVNLIYFYDNYTDYGYTPDIEHTPDEALDDKIDCGFIKQIDVTGVHIEARLDNNKNITGAEAEIVMLFTDKNDDENEMVTTFEFTSASIGSTTVEIPEEIMDEIYGR